MFGTIDFSGPGKTIRTIWNTLAPLPGGKLLFSKVLGIIAPYTGTVGLRIEELGPGYARIHIIERRRIRNHLNSIHAVALMNLAEATTGLALLLALPDNARGIPVELSIEYHKKSRGRVTAECRCDPPCAAVRHETAVTCEIHNEAGELVATGRARWNISPRPG